MTCPECGAKNANGLSYCSACGCSLKKINTSAPKPIDPHVPYDPYDPKQNPNAPTLGMKWFKFTIYFYLFDVALSFLISGILLLTGSLYEKPELYYATFAGLRPLDVTYAIISFILAAFFIFVRFFLAGYKRNAPALLTAGFLCDELFRMVYAVCTLVIQGKADLLDTMFLIGSVISIVVGIIATVIFVNLNRSYFRKRSFLFVN